MKRVNCLDPEQRQRECEEHAYRYTGRIPCTGPQTCMYCNKVKEDRPCH